MRNGQHVRIRPASHLCEQLQLAPDAEGVVVCEYQILAHRPRFPHRIDVRFAEGQMFWGVPSDAFVEVEPAERLKKTA